MGEGVGRTRFFFSISIWVWKWWINHGWNGVITLFSDQDPMGAMHVWSNRSNAELHKLLLLAYGRQLEAQNSGLYGIFGLTSNNQTWQREISSQWAFKWENHMWIYVFFFFPLQCLMNYQGIQFAISPSGGGFACSNVFHPTIPLNGCIYILVILPWTSMPNYPIRWFPRLTGLHFRGVFCGIPWFSPQRPKILEDPLSFGFNGHPARCSSQKAMVERPCCLAAMWQVMDICQKNDETKGWCRYGSKIE